MIVLCNSIIYITPFEDGNNYEINLNNIELYEFDNFNNQLEQNTEHQHIETVECEEKSLQSIDEETLNTPSTIISPITENQNIEVVEYEKDIHNNLQNDGRKRNRVSNPNSWSRNETKIKRLKGESYIGYRRKEKDNTFNILHDTPREGRNLGPPCQSKVCEKWKTRFCLDIKNEERLDIFKNFWSMTSWREKQIFVLSLVEKVIPKQRTTESATSRRNGSYFYYLKIGNDKLGVCKQMFLSTLGIKENTLRYWLEYKNQYGSQAPRYYVREEVGIEDEEIYSLVNETNKHITGNSRRAIKHKNNYLNTFFDKLPKLPSHYCRKSSRKLYLQTEIKSITQLYNIYFSECKTDNEKPLCRKAFDNIFFQKNLSIFSPKKDQCDKCCQYNLKNLPEEELTELSTKCTF
ncbi:hypothetical protein ACI65C_004465 [Semiaphis heraclei]